MDLDINRISNGQFRLFTSRKWSGPTEMAITIFYIASNTISFTNPPHPCPGQCLHLPIFYAYIYFIYTPKMYTVQPIIMMLSEKPFSTCKNIAVWIKNPSLLFSIAHTQYLYFKIFVWQFILIEQYPFEKKKMFIYICVKTTPDTIKFVSFLVFFEILFWLWIIVAKLTCYYHIYNCSVLSVYNNRCWQKVVLNKSYLWVFKNKIKGLTVFLLFLFYLFIFMKQRIKEIYF